ncbi:MAG: hypothetical protein OXG25_10205 [Gammaproteobacteria bacterium]|nr:hypothetical protein [Gammaproteobacteria bacterium]
MASAYQATINGQPITIAINAVAWAQPAAASWLTRCRELNRLLGKHTHLLCVSASDRPEPIWYAGAAGTSLAAGIEQMAIVHETLRESIVAFPLDERIYVANLQKGLVREEWVLYVDAFATRVQAWRAEGRHFILLTGGGRTDTDLPNAARLPIDIDTKVMMFKHASIALLAAGLLRWRDCGILLGMIIVTIGLSLALSLWDRAPSVRPLQQVAALVAQPTLPVRHRASADLAELAMLVSVHDEALWRLHGATEFEYDAAQDSVVLHSDSATRLSTTIVTGSTSPEPPQLQPFTIEAFRMRLTTHLASPSWTLTFGEPYPVGSEGKFEQHVTVLIDIGPDAQGVSMATALVDLSERLMRLPITLHRVDCTISEGAFDMCELSLTIRGLGA